MEAISITTRRRDGTRKGFNRKLRAQGRIPAVLYGHGIEKPVNLELDPRDLQKVFQHPKGANALIELQVDGDGSHQVLMREVQRHAVSRRVLHVDFVAPDPQKHVVVEVPLRITGRSPGVLAGGRLRTPYRSIKVRALPAAVPAEAVVDISSLRIGQTLSVTDVQLPEGVEAVYDRPFVVAKVAAPRGGVVAGAEEGAEGAEAAEA